MVCPRCSETLVREVKDGEEIDACRSCEGMWLHKHQLDSLLKESGGDVELCSIDDNPHTDKNPEINCRECTDVKMKKINFLEFSDIIIDHCPSCGSFWVDKNELENMHKYIEKVEKGSHEVNDANAYSLLEKLSKIAYSIFH